MIVERIGARAAELLTRVGLHERAQLHVDRSGVEARAGAFAALDGLIGFAAFMLCSPRRGSPRRCSAACSRWRPRGSSCTCSLCGERGSSRGNCPEILDTLAASLRAGHGFDHGLQTVASDVGEPAGREFKRVVAEVHLGRSLEDALADLGRRIRSADLQFVLDAIAIQRQVGGSLAELFELVAQTVRAREQFRRNLRAVTGQVRISANVLTFMPAVAAAGLTLLNPHYMSPLWHTSSGHIVALVAFGMVFCGSFVLRRVGAVRW